jgi:cytochrome c551/c552
MKNKNLFLIFFVVLISIAFIYLGFVPANLFQQKQTGENNLPENPLKGRIVFEQKGCIDCHAINGYGGNTAPDFGTHNFFGSDFDLISQMWNHSPNMIREMGEKNIDKQKFSGTDFSNLRYFLYFLRYLGSSGNVSKGQELFSKMKCSSCHSVNGENTKKIRLDKIGVYATPLYLAQVMWNHSAKMQKMQKLSGIKIPEFKNNDFADLSAYIAEVSTYGERKKIYMSPGNPLKGEKLFDSKKCSYCHVQNHIGPDLTNFNFNKSVTEIAGMMWNHASNMEKVMEKNKISWPAFEGDEMANLISYLYFKNRSDIKGSVEEGKQLIKDKGCGSCHNSGNSYGAPDINTIGPFSNVDDFFSELWNHLPLMEKNLYAKGKSLPKLLPSDIKSLYLYFSRKNR